MTRDDHARKAAVRARMATTHEPYSVAARNLGGSARPATGLDGNARPATGLAGNARPATGVGTPRAGWPAWAAKQPATVAVWRNRDGQDEIAVLESGTDKRLAALSVSHVPTETLLANASTPDSPSQTQLPGLFTSPPATQPPPAHPTAPNHPTTTNHTTKTPPASPHTATTQPTSHHPAEAPPTRPRHTAQTPPARPPHRAETSPAEPGSPDGLGYDQDLVVALGRPDLAAHRLGYQVRGGWHPWTDGSWRSPAAPADTRHTVTASPEGSGLRVVVREQPGDLIVAEAVVSVDRLDAGLDRLGYTAAGGHWSRLPGGVFYARARTGHLAERDWWTEARVRLLRRIDAAEISFEVGQVFVMNQHGPAGAEVDRGWWSAGAQRVPATAVQVLEVLEDHPPTWLAAALTVDRVVELLEPYHPHAERAATAWIAQRLHVAQARDALVIRTPGPEYRVVGRIGRDYWFGNVHSDRYQVTLPDNQLRELAELPLDPVAASEAMSQRP